MSGQPNEFVRWFEPLNDKPNPSRALAMLERVASLVKPIMRKHDWSLPVLAEFFPQNPNLLGMNRNGGEKILLRLRPHYDDSAFLPEEDVVGTMLHELTHNVHGPHDEKFYKLLGQLEDEFDELQRNGYAGEGFHTPGARLGAGVSHDLPPHLARQKALQSAEKRRALGLGSQPNRLGGGVRAADRTKSLRELAAEAAERRARDAKACGAESSEVEIEVQRAADHSTTIAAAGPHVSAPQTKGAVPSRGLVNSVASTSQSRPPPVSIAAPAARHALTGTPASDLKRSQTSSVQPAGASSSGPVRTARHGARVGPVIQRPPSHSQPLPRRTQPNPGSEWSCPTCTLLNRPLALQCDACQSIRPSSTFDSGSEHSDEDARGNSEHGWICVSCGRGGTSHEFWSCKFCGEIRPFS